MVLEQVLAPVPGGTGRYARELAVAMASQRPADWRVRPVVAWHSDTTAAAVDGAEPVRRLPVGHRALAELWRRGRPPWPGGDTVHATTPLAPPRHGRPLIATVHDVVPWTHPETLTPRGVAWHRDLIGRLAVEADAIVVPTRAVADQLVEVLPAAAGKVHPIPHGVTNLPVPADAADRRRRLGLPDVYVLAVATLEPRKGLDVLLAAAALPALRGAMVAVVGQPGWGGLDLGRSAAELGLGPERLRTLGRLSDDDLAAVMAGAAVLAVPSRAEGFGLPLLEGMAVGVPVVHTAVPALVEVAGGAGLTVPVGEAAGLADAVATVLGDPIEAGRLRTAGRARAAEFTWAAAAAATWQLHQEAAG